MTRPDPVHLLVADDHPVFRHGLANLLGQEEDLEVVAEASTGAEAVAAAGRLVPDVVLMDIAMSDLSGIAATRQIVEANPHIAVLMLSMLDDDESVFAAMRAGARGYLLKEAEHEEIVRAVLATAHGESVFGSRIAQQVLGFLTDRGRADRRVFPGLSDREREVLELIAQGHRNAEIARSLGIAPKTVRNHAYNIFVKLQVADRAAAIIMARDAGLGVAQSPGVTGTPAS